MLIGGIHRFSLIDYPAKTACVVFTQGCNFRCPYCHNPELVELDSLKHRLMQKPFFDFLSDRHGKLDAVVITGGEPTLQQDLVDFITKIRGLDFQVKLDTNGTNPAVIAELLQKNLIQFIAMDVKAPLEKYSAVAGVDCEEEKIKAVQQSIKLIINSTIDYAFRTTVVRHLLTPEDILKIGDTIRGANHYILQRFVASKTYRPEFINAESFSDEELESLASELKKSFIKHASIR